ncbi:MAG: hypothetical protein Q9181_002707 [Wetmoreana brouardii]
MSEFPDLKLPKIVVNYREVFIEGELPSDQEYIIKKMEKHTIRDKSEGEATKIWKETFHMKAYVR